MGKEKIIGVAEGYIKDIKDAQAGIEKEMPNHFKDHVNKLDADMQPRVDAKGQEALAEITKLVSNEGEIGREQITKDLRDVRDGSVKELEEAIRKAKKELEDLIIEETNASNRATKENLNKQIDAKKIEINELVREQEVFQMKSIAIVGRDLQEEAIRDLDKIIEDYFK